MVSLAARATRQRRESVTAMSHPITARCGRRSSYTAGEASCVSFVKRRVEREKDGAAGTPCSLYARARECLCLGARLRSVQEAVSPLQALEDRRGGSAEHCGVLAFWFFFVSFERASFVLGLSDTEREGGLSVSGCLPRVITSVRDSVAVTFTPRFPRRVRLRARM